MRLQLDGRLDEAELAYRKPSLIAAGFDRVLRQMWIRWCTGLAPATL
jgi:hypothetical protein